MAFKFSVLGYKCEVSLSNPPTWQFVDVHMTVVQKPVVVGIVLNIVGLQAAISIAKVVAE